MILPFAPLLAAIVAHVQTDRLWLDAPALVHIERAILGIVLLLAWRLRRGRVAWATLGLAAVAELAALTAPADVLEAALLLAGLWLVLDLAAAAVLGEWWFLSQTGLWRLGVLGVQAISVIWLSAAAPSTRHALISLDESWIKPESALERLPLEPLFLLILALALLVAGIAAMKRRSPLEFGLLGALLATAAAFAVDGGLRYYLAVAGLVLAVALVENAFSLAFNDGLTGLPARRALEERLQQLPRRFSLAMLDLDHFKKLNDRHGHEVGDQVLRLVASRLRKAPGGGEAFRYGGEEFTVVFSGQGAEEAAIYLEALRQHIASRPFVVRSPGRPAKKPAKKNTKGQKSQSRPQIVEKSLKVTVSIGVAQRDEKTKTPETVMKAADRALYKSKKAGRNRVTVG